MCSCKFTISTTMAKPERIVLPSVGSSRGGRPGACHCHCHCQCQCHWLFRLRMGHFHFLFGTPNSQQLFQCLSLALEFVVVEFFTPNYSGTTRTSSTPVSDASLPPRSPSCSASSVRVYSLHVRVYSYPSKLPSSIKRAFDVGNMKHSTHEPSPVGNIPSLFFNGISVGTSVR